MTLADATQPQTFAELLQSMPATWTLVLGAALVLGLVLWVFGGKLAKKGVMMTGFVAGGLGATALAMGLGLGTEVAGAEGSEAVSGEAASGETSGGGLWILGVGGAVAGVLLAALLFRFWMGALTGALLAAVVPLAGMIWQGNAPPLSAVRATQDVTLKALGAGQSLEEAEDLRQQRGFAGPDRAPATAGERSYKKDLQEAAVVAAVVFDRDKFVQDLQAVWGKQVQDVKTWWQEMDAGPRRFLTAAAGVGGVVGVLLGLISPLIAAALQSALVGSALILFSLRTLILGYVPAAEGVLPGSWRGVLLSLGLITLLGVLIQWTLRSKESDE